MITVVSRPDDFSAAYLPVQYTFTSNLSPNSEPLENTTVSFIKADPQLIVGTGIGAPALLILDDPINTIAVGDFIKINNVNPTNQGYDGEHQVVRIDSPNQFIIDKPYTGIDGFGGTAQKFYRNFSIVIDLFIDNAFKARLRAQKDTESDFSFDVQRVLQAFLASDLQTVGNTAIDFQDTFARNFFIKYAEEFDVPDALGVPQLTIQDFTDDVANTKLASNTIIPYVFIRRGVIESITYSVNDFVLDGTNDRFLTEMPKTVRIYEDESAQLSILVKGTILPTPPDDIRRRVETFDITGASLGFTDTIFSTGSAFSDSGWTIPTGTANIIFASNVAKYEVTIITATPLATTISEVITYVIDRDCRRTKRRFHWDNSRGGIDAYTFIGKDTFSEQVKKREFKRNLDFPRVTPERTWTTTQNTPFLRFTTGLGMESREVREWLKEILSSPNVWIEQEGIYLPVRISTTKWNLSESTKPLDSITLAWEYAFDEQAQRN